MQPDLISLSMAGEAAFALPLADGKQLNVEAIIRRVPANRIVCKGHWNGQAVYAKLFLGTSAKRHAHRDADGIQQLLAANILTPKLVYQGQANTGEEVLMFEAIADGKNAEEALNETAIGSDARFALLQKLMLAVAGHHQAGLMQTDLYFKNFLIQDEQIYTLDGDGIQKLPSFFKRYRQMQNLATLFSKMDVLDDALIEPLYALYCQKLGKTFSVMDMSDVWQKTQFIRHQVAARYAFKKVFRNCTDVKVWQDFRHFIAVSTGFNATKETLLSLDDCMKENAVIKNGRTCTVAKVDLAGQSVVVKRYNIKNYWHAISRIFRPTRAAKSWANAHYLNISSIDTPKPLALIEQRFGLLRWRAYFVSAYIDAPDVAEFFRDNADTELKHRVALELAHVFYKLSLLRISHGDCKASNIKILNEQVMLIDLDAMTIGGFFYRQKHIRDLKRFMQNWAHDLETTAILKHAFMMVYDENDPYSTSVLGMAGIAS